MAVWMCAPIAKVAEQEGRNDPHSDCSNNVGPVGHTRGASRRRCAGLSLQAGQAGGAQAVYSLSSGPTDVRSNPNSAGKVHIG
jgi:hypothetical protein